MQAPPVTSIPGSATVKSFRGTTNVNVENLSVAIGRRAATFTGVANAAALTGLTDATRLDIAQLNDGSFYILLGSSPTTLANWGKIDIVASTAWLVEIASTQSFKAMTNIVRDANGAVVSADVVWPDGTPGVFTTDTASTAFPGAIDAYHVTYGTPTQKTVTQPAVTRNSTGAVTSQPAMTVS